MLLLLIRVLSTSPRWRSAWDVNFDLLLATNCARRNSQTVPMELGTLPPVEGSAEQIKQELSVFNDGWLAEHGGFDRFDDDSEAVKESV